MKIPKELQSDEDSRRADDSKSNESLLIPVVNWIGLDITVDPSIPLSADEQVRQQTSLPKDGWHLCKCPQAYVLLTTESQHYMALEDPQEQAAASTAETSSIRSDACADLIGGCATFKRRGCPESVVTRLARTGQSLAEIETTIFPLCSEPQKSLEHPPVAWDVLAFPENNLADMPAHEKRNLFSNLEDYVCNVLATEYKEE